MVLIGRLFSHCRHLAVCFPSVPLSLSLSVSVSLSHLRLVIIVVKVYGFGGALSPESYEMRSPVSTFMIIFLSIIIIILLFNRGAIVDTVHETYRQYLAHHHGSSKFSPTGPQSSATPDSRISAPAAEVEHAVPHSKNNTAAVVPAVAQPAARFPHLSALCASTTFTPSLYLHCHSFGGPHSNAINGGLSNARNRYSTCIRLAIDASANLILGPLMQRDNENLWNTNWKQVGPERMLDIADLQRGLKEACPGMDVRGCPEGGCDTAEEGETVVRAPDHDHRRGSFTTGRFREMVDTTIAEQTNGTMAREDVTVENSVKVEFGDSFLGWNYTAVHESRLKAEIYRILHFSPSLLSLGQKVQNAAKQATGGRDIVGIHFRGEGDWPSSVCNASAQIEMYSNVLTRWNNFRLWKWKLKDIYLSCGDQERVQMFREAMAPLGFTVHDKHSLLNNTEAWGDEETLKEIEDLNFDQKAVVEYVNLRDASRFLGLLPSTLSYIVAYERTLDQALDAPMDAGENTAVMRLGVGKGRKWQTVEKEKVGWFEKYILAGSWRGEELAKHWPEAIQMRGDEKTKLLVVDGQSELSDAFP